MSFEGFYLVHLFVIYYSVLTAYLNVIKQSVKALGPLLFFFTCICNVQIIHL